jgi:hypothetical protein
MKEYIVLESHQNHETLANFFMTKKYKKQAFCGRFVSEHSNMLLGADPKVAKSRCVSRTSMTSGSCARSWPIVVGFLLAKKNAELLRPAHFSSGW